MEPDRRWSDASAEYIRRPFLASHERHSYLDWEIMRLASGEKNTEVTQLVCPRSSGKSWAPVVTSQTRTVQSHEPEATRRASGENINDKTPPSCPRISD